jgi:magnesium-dependent phosphatase 1
LRSHQDQLHLIGNYALLCIKISICYSSNILYICRAKKAIGLLRIPELSNSTLIENVDYCEIYPGSKIKHFTALSQKSGIACHEMLFFDDEARNREVTKLGVHFVKVNTTIGITLFQFENALHTYVSNAGVKQTSVKDFFTSRLQ